MTTYFLISVIDFTISAGLGKRFKDEGFPTPKPLIKVSGKPMFVQAAKDLPAALRYAFVMGREMGGESDTVAALDSHFPGAIVLELDGTTEGQAFTALAGIDAVAETLKSGCEPLTIAASDSGSVYDHAELDRLLNDATIDVIVWGFRRYPNALRQPQMYGWVEERDGRVEFISVKEPLHNPASDPIVVGTFIFKKAGHFKKCLDRLVARNGRVNGEYYIDSLVNDAVELGLKCELFEVSHYTNWGTPDDLRTFEYWQSFFSKWKQHPYSLEKDSRVAAAEIAVLEERFSGESFLESLDL